MAEILSMQFWYFVENAIQYCNQIRLTYIAREVEVFAISVIIRFPWYFIMSAFSAIFTSANFGMFLENIVLGA